MRHVQDGWTTWGIRLRCPKLDPHCVYICYVLLCIVLFYTYVIQWYTYVILIVSIICYNICYNICIHICYRCLINIMIMYIYIYWLSDLYLRFAMNTPNTSGIPQLLRLLAHRAAFLDFLVKSRLEPRNTASYECTALRTGPVWTGPVFWSLMSYSNHPKKDGKIAGEQ